MPVPPPAAILRQEAGLLAEVFFSTRNVEVLQNSLRYRVYRDSGGQVVVGRQSDTELLAIMREVFEGSDRHAPDRLVILETRRLNAEVLRVAAPLVLSSASFHRHYLADVERGPPAPPDHPQLMTARGTKVLDPFDRLR